MDKSGFFRFSLVFRVRPQLLVARHSNAIADSVGSVKAVLGCQLVQVFQHGLSQAQIDPCSSHSLIVDRERCTRGRYTCTHVTPGGDTAHISAYTEVF